MAGGLATWGGSVEIDSKSMYKASFGEIPDGTTYDDGLNKIEMLVDDSGELTINNGVLNKAVNVGAASGVAGYALTPIVWDRDVVDITRRLTPLLTVLPKVTNDGKVAQYYRITGRGDATWQAEDPALTETDDTKEEVSTAIKYLRIAGRVTGVAQVAGKHFESSMQREVINKTQSMNEAIEAMILTGDNSSNSYQPDGLQKILVTGNDATETAVGGAIALSDVTELVNQCFVKKGAPNLIITDPFTATDLIEQQMDYVRYTDPNITIAWGLQVPSIQTVVGRLPMLISQFMPAGSGDRRLFCINTNYVQRRVLQDITFERLAKTSDSEKFLLKTYSTLINKFPSGMGQLTGITN